jgi:hypothetical protein
MDLPLVSGLLKQAGCATVGGCHKIDDNSVGADFRTGEDAIEFLDVMAAYGPECGAQTAIIPSAVAESPFPETLYDRIMDCGSPGDWSYEVEPDGWESEELDEDGEPIEDPTDSFPLGVSMRFPRADLPLIRERLAKAVQDPRRPAGPNGVCLWWDGCWEDGDQVLLLLALCKGAIGACLPCPGGRPNTASLTFSNFWMVRELLHLMEEVSAEAEHPWDGGPGPGGVDPDEAKYWAFEARAEDDVIEEKGVNGVVVRPQFNFAVTVRIPIADLPSVYQRLYKVALDHLPG